ncbi:M48 family metallopeptidase [candidate division WOR-3 bacterium]|uniref:M48 family metallopeptidase n=1 Tax=candidate division WOR-3 bacterium TaxID=2052148 RepID=A0A938BP41_UNCW3|nr:M48 family metallopeptidase [candidate division WOR-3 bacterium]
MLLSNGTELVYRVRIHPRARHVRIVVSQRHGLVVTVPRRFDQRRIPEILEQKRDWIERTLRRLPIKPEPYRPPERIALAAIGEEWDVEYKMGNPKRIELLEHSDRTLLVSGAVGRPNLVRRILQRWLAIQARKHLVPWLHRTATELGFELKGVTVRTQRTLWASCSRRNTISLNARLLLLSPDLVRYIFIHELMHIRHPNHSRAFWQAVAVHVPDFRERLKELRHRMESLCV